MYEQCFHFSFVGSSETSTHFASNAVFFFKRSVPLQLNESQVNVNKSYFHKVHDHESHPHQKLGAGKKKIHHFRVNDKSSEHKSNM